MCGISGIISKRNAPVSPGLIKKVSDLVIHRGPDSEGFYFGANFALGHRRLSILDLSDHGHQPMEYLNRYWITYNGEVYNYLEIRKELETLGYVFRSGTDTEVILAAYDRWGYECLNRFNGMWAFALYDAKEKTLFFARDRFGIKPLYYLETPGQFAFGSEIKQLLALQSGARANRRVVIEALLTLNDGHTEDTYFEGIKSFPQAHYGYYDLSTHRLKTVRYYELKVNDAYKMLSLEEAASQVSGLFHDAVRLRLRADVQVGTCLSGGMDSSAVSGVASQLYHADSNGRFVGIHAKSTEARTDESAFADAAARHLGVELHTVEPRLSDFTSTVDELVTTQEEPFVSCSMFMGWHVFQKAKSIGCKVMLNGQGGDEVLLGYERYFSALLQSLSWTRFMPEAVKQAQSSGLSTAQILLNYLYFTRPALRALVLKRRSVLREECKKAHYFETIALSAEKFRRIDAMQIHEISVLQLPHLLRYEDRNSMRHSIETRLPFLDYTFVECCLSLPSEYKIRDGWTKYIFRKAMENILPPEIVWRRNKFGFEAPQKEWVEGSRERITKEIKASHILREITQEKQLERALERMSHREIWPYFMVAAWERVYNVAW